MRDGKTIRTTEILQVRVGTKIDGVHTTLESIHTCQIESVNFRTNERRSEQMEVGEKVCGGGD